MKTIQTCVLLILLFAANTYSQDVIASEKDHESITASPSQNENPEALGTNPDEKVPEGETDYLTTISPQDTSTQGIMLSSLDIQQNEENIPTAIPEVLVSKESSTEIPTERPDEESKGTTLSELEPIIPTRSTSEQIPIETANPENEIGQPIEPTLVPEIEKDSKGEVSEANEAEVPSEVNTGTSETETSKTETEAEVEDAENTDSPATNEFATETEIPSELKPVTSYAETFATDTPPEENKGTSETDTSITVQTETEVVVEDAKNTELPATNNESVTESEIPSEVKPGASETESSKTEQAVTEAATDNKSTTETDETAATYTESELNQVTAENSNDPIEGSSTTITPCTEVGNFANPTNCRQYLSCSGNATNFISENLQCPERSAFSPVLGRCSRDLSPCLDEEPVCLRAGSISNPNGENSSYFWCVPSLLGGFHKYQIQCSENEVFVPLFGRCWNLAPQLGLGFGLINREPSDREIVRAEWKLLRREIKQKAKAEKLQKKMEEKAIARAEKLAAKELKKQKETVRKVDDEDQEDESDD